MMRIIYAGDFHGNLDALSRITQSCDKKADSCIVQVGDFGFGFSDKAVRKWLEKRARISEKRFITTIYTCLGNHDNWDLADQIEGDVGQLVPGSYCFFVKRGTLFDIFGIPHLFFGGAESTDPEGRTPGVDWWAREQGSPEEFNLFKDNLSRANTVVTHDAPLRVPLDRPNREFSLTTNQFELAYEEADNHPEYHFFGHHHMLNSWHIQNTHFQCCGLEGQYVERKVEF